MKRILNEIQTGQFAKEWISENQAGQLKFKQMQKQEASLPIEIVGKELRSKMSFLSPEKKQLAAKH